MNNATNAIEPLLDEAITLARGLLRALDAERHSLTTRDQDPLKAAVLAKSELVAALEHLERQPQAAFGGATLHDWLLQSRASTEDAQPLDDGLVTRRSTLAVLLRQCQANNALNGRLVQRARQGVQELLGLVQGGSRADLTYGEAGVKNGGKPDPRTIARA